MDELDQYLDALARVYFQAVMSREHHDLLSRMGGIMRVAARDVEQLDEQEAWWEHLVDIRGMHDRRRQRAVGLWRAHRRAIGEQLVGTSPRLALERFFRTYQTRPNSLAAVQHMGQETISTLGALPQWRFDLTANRSRIQRQLDTLRSPWGAIATAAAWGYIIATDRNWQEHIPENWERALSVGEFGALFGDLVEAHGRALQQRQQIRDVQHGPEAGHAAQVQSQAAGRSTRGVSPAQRQTQARGADRPGGGQAVQGRAAGRGGQPRAAATETRRAPASASSAVAGSTPAPAAGAGARVQPGAVGQAPPPASQDVLSRAVRTLRRNVAGLADAGRSVETRTRDQAHRRRAVEGRRMLDRAARVLDSLVQSTRNARITDHARGFIAALNPFDIQRITRTLWGYRQHLVQPLRRGMGASDAPAAEQSRASRSAVLNAVVGVLGEMFGRQMISSSQRARATAQARRAGVQSPVIDVQLRTRRDRPDPRRQLAEAGDPGLRVAVQGGRLFVFGLVETKAGRAGTSSSAMQRQLEGMRRRLTTEPVRVEMSDGRVVEFSPDRVVLAPALTITTIMASDVRAPTFTQAWTQQHFPGGHFHATMPLTRAQIRDVAAAFVAAGAQAFRVPGQEGRVRRTQREQLRPEEQRAR